MGSGSAYGGLGNIMHHQDINLYQRMAQQQQSQTQQHQHMMQQIYPGQAMTINSQSQKQKRNIMKLFRDYLEAHRDTIFTLVLILLADHFVFKGAFSETIKAAFSKLLDKAHQKIDEKIEKKL